jgi:hypothetical protein
LHTHCTGRHGLDALFLIHVYLGLPCCLGNCWSPDSGKVLYETLHSLNSLPHAKIVRLVDVLYLPTVSVGTTMCSEPGIFSSNIPHSTFCWPLVLQLSITFILIIVARVYSSYYYCYHFFNYNSDLYCYIYYIMIITNLIELLLLKL